MEYTQSYENSLHFSPGFQKFAADLADRLITRYNLRGKDVIDIGCGKGDFLKLICARGGNRGVGFDPSYVPDPADSAPRIARPLRPRILLRGSRVIWSRSRFLPACT